MDFIDELPKNATSADELYELYRFGLISRHICLNGRLDELTWLRERGTREDARLDLNRRQRFERFRRAMDTSAGLAEEMIWWPVGHHLATPQTVPPNPSDTWLPLSLGGGDNALLTGGLALAAFALEAMHGVSQHALDYAHQLFSYFLRCELPGRGGFFVKIANTFDRTPVKFASLDDIIGMCVGLLFYARALKQLGKEAELAQVVGLVARMAANLNAHGYWIVPYADDFSRTDVNLGAAFCDSTEFSPPTDAQQWSRQLGFVFAYPFRLFFKEIGGVDTNCTWDDHEFQKYFREEFPAQATNITNAAKWLTLANLTQVFGLPAFTLDDFVAWSIICEFAKSYFDPQNILDEAWKRILEGLFSISEKVEKNFFSIHLFALASILVLECQSDVGIHRWSAEALSAIVKGEHGKLNAFLALVALRGGAEGAHLNEAIAILTKVPTPGDSVCFQPDLPLATIKAFGLLPYPPGEEPLPELQKVEPDPAIVENERAQFSRVCEAFENALGAFWPNQSWRDELRARNLPFQFNIDQQWGQERTWESAISNHVFGRGWQIDDFRGPSLWKMAAELFADDHSDLAMTLEAPGVDLVFPRMLAGAWGLLPRPVIANGRDHAWSTLPYLGASPLERNPLSVYRIPFWSATLHHNHRSHPQKQLVRLSRKGGHRVEETGQWHGLHHSRAEKPPYGILWGNEHTIFNEIFRGSRGHVYSAREVICHANGLARVFRAQWEYYIEVAESTEALQRVPEWRPVSSEAWDGTCYRSPYRSIGSDVGWFDGHVDESIILSQLPKVVRSSFLFCVMRVHLALPGPSVGNALAWTGPVTPLWLRLGHLPSPEPYPYILNAHQGTVHDLRSSESKHIEAIARAFNLLVLPITVSVDRSWSAERLAANLASILQMGRPSDDGGAWPAFPLMRRDHYDLDRTVHQVPSAYTYTPPRWPPPRLTAYLSSHPDAKARYETANTRRLHLCSMCFRK